MLQMPILPPKDVLLFKTPNCTDQPTLGPLENRRFVSLTVNLSSHGLGRGQGISQCHQWLLTDVPCFWGGGGEVAFTAFIMSDD